MTNWWESDALEVPNSPSKVRAIAYYRHSAQDRQENSIPIQQDQVREWAEKNGVEIIREFADAGKSGLTSEGRPAFTEMMDEWVSKRNDFVYILCLDVSRWGRFQDIDLSAEFSAQCKKHRKQVIYTSIGKPREDDPLYPVYVQFERFRAAQYSRELSDKVWRGCVRIVEQGYWAGGPPPYATQRLLLDEKREPLHKLEPGQRKGIQNQRVTLMEGDPAQVATIQRIFHEFVECGYSGIRERRVKTDRKVPVIRSGAYLIGEDVSKEGVIHTIQKLCRGGYGLSAKGNRRRDRRLYHAALKHFRTWRQALFAAGINPQRIYARQGESKNRSELIAELRQLQRVGQSLSLSDVFLENRALALGVRSAFGSWKRGLLAAGLIDTSQLGKPLPVDRQQVLDAIRLRREAGQSLIQRIVEKDQRNLVYSAKLYFSSWHEAVEAALNDTHGSCSGD